MEVPKTQDKLKDNVELVQDLIRKQKLVESIVHGSTAPKQELVESLVHRQHGLYDISGACLSVSDLNGN